MTDEPKKIVIDLAGAMDKITPEMMDKARDIMIEALIKSGDQMRISLERIIVECEMEYATLDNIKEIARKGLPK